MILKKSDLAALIKSLAKKYDFYGPVGETFEKIRSMDEINLRDKTIYSAKKIFLPQREELFSFSKEKIHNPKKMAKPVIVFGLRPCDLHGLKYMDEFFKSDTIYEGRRKKITVFGLQCTKCFKNCFCHLTNTYQSNYCDALFIEAGNDFFVDAKSDMAKAMLENAGHARTATEKEIDEIMEIIKNNFQREGELRINDAPIDGFTRDCFSCCACTSVCPTCTCFDIEDRLDHIRVGKRVRQWDSCQSQNFTRVAGDFIFMPDRHSRVKQRIYCKFDYTKKRTGKMSCVGCGRCVDVCTKGIDIFEVFR